MTWRIDRSYLDKGEFKFTMNATGEGSTKNTPNRVRFRILDDDDVVYFGGWSTDSVTAAAFAPLDWAADRYGATAIDYRDPDTGEWERL
jgi:hypothetical protein